VVYAACDTPDEGMEHVLAHRLGQAGATLAVAESCTGGMLCSKLVGVPGVSGVLKEGVVAYANAAKVRDLGVDPALLERHGAVSEETCRAMAEGLRARAGVDYALSTTGVAGPDGGTAEKPVGLVWVGCAGPRGTAVKRLDLFSDREGVRHLACLHAMGLLLAELDDTRR
jgi:nicotinamide-nucleotide amidase